MAVADQPSGLMDIASSLTQDEIPFKLRCAICNNLAVNAFRLPCCDQAICENCQTSLPETCPVCAHTPISSDLCKPNKALRTTLKAFLRTEEKKREKERQAALPAVTEDAPATDGVTSTQEVSQEAPAVEAKAAEEPNGPSQTDMQPPGINDEANSPNIDPSSAPDVSLELPKEGSAEADHGDNGPSEAADNVNETGMEAEPGEGDTQGEGAIMQPPGPETMFSNQMGYGMNPGMFPNMGWNNNSGDLNPMAQFMGNGMVNFPNPMGMPGMSGMSMDPMAVNQGMFGGYGMNMSGMNNGMNMGMNFNAGQGMYGGWDSSQNNMWNGSQDKFNPNAFANGMGAQYGGPSGFGGYNISQPNGIHGQMQQQFPNQDFQNGYYGPGYVRGSFRGRGRGFISGGRGRGGFTGQHMQANYPPNANYPAFQNNNSPSMNQDLPSQAQEDTSTGMSPRDVSTAEDKNIDDGTAPVDGPDSSKDPVSLEANRVESGSAEPIPSPSGPADQVAQEEEQQLQGIPTIDSLDQLSNPHAIPGGHMGPSGHMGPGFGRGGYMRGQFQVGRGGGFNNSQFPPGNNMSPMPRGQGVEGAPAAPRAMREGLPNTSVLRHRNYQAPTRSSMTPTKGPEAINNTPPDSAQGQLPLQEDSRSRSRPRSKSKSRSKSRSRSPSHSRSNSRRRYRQRSASPDNKAEDTDRKEGRPRRSRQDEKSEPLAAGDERSGSRSPSLDSRRSSNRERDRDKRGGRRSHRSHRRRSRSRSPSASRKDAQDADRLSTILEESSSRPRNKNVETMESSSRGYRSGKDRPSRREEERGKDRDTRRRDRDRDRDRDRYRDRERERDRDRDRHRERDKDRERDRKRSRRDRSESGAANSDYSSRHHSRRIKRSREDDIRTSSDKDRAREAHDKAPSLSKPSEPEKDPHTLEREARNRERMLKEQQRREAMHADRDSGKSNRRRDSRQERGSGRRINYKYDDEGDADRAARVEKEREASRWA